MGTVLRCHVVINEVGVKQYIPYALEDGKKVTPINDGVVAFNAFPNGDKVDMRATPPFAQILPCPYCDSQHENKHEPLKHVDSKRGFTIAEVEKAAKERNITTSQAHKWLLERRNLRS